MAGDNQTIVGGILELEGKGFGFLRPLTTTLSRLDGDVYVGAELIRQFSLRPGSFVEGGATEASGRSSPKLQTITQINGLAPEAWSTCEQFENLTPIAPEQQLVLSKQDQDVSLRTIDLICPIGRGQRALVVAQPRSGKTILIQKIAQAISKTYPDVSVNVLLLDERPEEVTDMRRTIDGDVFASSNDENIETHLRLAQLVLEYAKRKVEAGRDVILLLDSLTRTGRAFNLGQRGSGRTMSGGIDASALQIPRKIFGAARKIENGGSLTIVATVLVGTGSRMDEFIFQEFKGTGNMELVLDRALADERIFPAINILESGTRKEELLYGERTPQYQLLRRGLSKMQNREAMSFLLSWVKKTKSNDDLLDKISKAGF
jgi:transcription termination factor Rho